ncbi:MAG: hypothetical protein PHW34_06975 [Hespellia sp.]|nr:hypothetical protein [Hespellia sp.]
MECRGAGKLKVVGIIFIIIGAIAVVIYGMGLAGSGLMVGMSSNIAEGSSASQTTVAQGGSLLMVMSGIGLIYGLVELIAGIMGVKNCRNREKAKSLMVIGSVLFILALISSIMSMVSNGFHVSGIIGLAFGVLLPFLFILGAKQNMA